MNTSLQDGRWQTHAHPAMNTEFTIRLRSGNAEESAAFAGECFRQLDDLESLLSRYREDSDIARINRLQTGESLLLHEDTWACLRFALEANTLTGGLFDITLGVLTLRDAALPEGKKTKLKGSLLLDPERPAIVCIESGRLLDLGGIGKGYAIDRMAETLRELGPPDALLSAGASTHLAIGPSAWPVELAASPAPLTIPLRGGSISVSGTGIQGDHIIHPAGQPVKPPAPRRVWVLASNATFSDALSTACFLATDERRRELLDRIPELSRILVENGDGKISDSSPASL